MYTIIIEGNFQRPNNLCIVWKSNGPVKPMKSLIPLLSFILEKRNLYYMHFFNKYNLFTTFANYETPQVHSIYILWVTMYKI